MNPINVEHANITLVAAQGDEDTVGELKAHREPFNLETGLPITIEAELEGLITNPKKTFRTTTFWRPTEEELKAMNEGGAVTHSVLGLAFAPMSIEVLDKSAFTEA